ncbi:hypothetical protein PRIPAC_89578 [Pristionchus pacificus]|uniref:Apple domain-containing protein n=1 Tax=Pristionchus pacificus TaxID=54126 RepID=A0A2A6B724_PRIPA|nr:hypothetical protein PRIPAC_89578 [Pristionchus pacificus]|eukprot:PDM61668.1 hypothetical protein PRIPAC_51110 [Pristionchus pacificus]
MSTQPREVVERFRGISEENCKNKCDSSSTCEAFSYRQSNCALLGSEYKDKICAAPTIVSSKIAVIRASYAKDLQFPSECGGPMANSECIEKVCKCKDGFELTHSVPKYTNVYTTYFVCSGGVDNRRWEVLSHPMMSRTMQTCS